LLASALVLSLAQLHTTLAVALVHIRLNRPMV
jgi:hypothetical protein